MRFRQVFVATLSAACLALPACASGTPGAIDRLFVAEMIPHHHLGMELIDQATRRVADTGVRRLVFEMSSYHQSELDLLHDWAGQWNVESATDIPGWIDATQLTELAALSGTDYDRRWLELMIEHHEGAIEIAQRQIGEGSHRASIEMAESVREVQERDIADMQSLLVSLGQGE